MSSFKLAHLSDPHLGPLPDPKLLQLFSKRFLGYLNWQRHRSKIMGASYLDRLIEDMKAKAPDHIAITGDLVNIALPLEISGARSWLEEIGEPRNVSVVPGNHDAYVPGAVRKARAAWWPYMCADDAPAAPEEDTRMEATFPYIRKRGDIALIGVTTGRASAPWFATGRVGSKQSKRLRAILEDLGRQPLFRVVMLHHPPFKDATRWHKRLSDASRVRAAIKRAGAELILHGHTHIDSFESIEGPNGPVPVVGVPSATSAPGGKKPAARYNLFTIEKTGSGWSCSMQEHGFAAPDTPVSMMSERQVAIP
ncbi:metallophosphoesterase family protein [Roseibium aggregatum]|uniref:Metallophosphoesterase n=1 Tax=Roseibium aggregatum TaxID=187304 RepID=A0A939J4K6_9HYPH|nr:metallophosphoesterase [Roseibium aggregatum]MBN9673678.1 metallophosphoesterase [Roseibium aggregatum]